MSHTTPSSLPSHRCSTRSPSRRARRLAAAVSLACAVASLVGCDRAEVEEQQVPAGSSPIAEGQSPSPAAPPAAGSPGSPTASPASGSEAETLPFAVPAGWTLDPEPRQMRLATYRAPVGDETVDVAVTRFPGDVGGELANVNRWRTQMSLPPVTEAELPALLTRFESGDVTGYALRVEGDITHMVAAGIRDPLANVTWFVRVIGPPETVDAVEGDVMAFARTIADALAGNGG